MVDYPANDITAELVNAGLKGNTVTLSQLSVFHQAIPVAAPVTVNLNGHVLRMFGQTEPVTITANGQTYTVTGPAGWFLDTAGNPIGPPHLANYHTNAQFNPFQVIPPDGVLTFENGTFDDNILIPTDAWDGAPIFPDPKTTGNKVYKVSVANFNGGVHNHPDPVHVEGTEMTVTYYTMSSKNCAIPPDPTVPGGCPGGIIGAGATTPNSGCIIKHIDTPECFLEMDGLWLGANVTDAKFDHCLVSGGGGSMDDTVWDSVVLNRPTSAGPVIEFNPGTWTDWLIKRSAITGNIGNPERFQGTYNKEGNNPATWPT
jgi:hypothetical protein